MDREDQRADLIAQIHDVAVDSGVWSTVVDRLADVLDARVGQISTFDAQTGTVIHIAPRTILEVLHDYAARWSHQNPLIEPAKRLPTGSVFTDHDLMLRERFGRTAIYRDFFAPHGLHESIGTTLTNDEADWAADR